MKVCVCLVCLRTFDKKQDDLESSEGVPLLTKFLKIVENYLQVSTVLTRRLLGISGGGEGEEYIFCEKCELAVVNPICQVYLELLSAQLRLSWELGQLGNLLENSQQSTSDKLRMMNLNALANQLGLDNVFDVEEFRKLLAQKCKLLCFSLLFVSSLLRAGSNFICNFQNWQQ